jgi:hypothetical protein
MYKILKDPLTNVNLCLLRLADNAFIPFDPANTDYQAYLKWLAEGGVPQEADDVSSQ